MVTDEQPSYPEPISDPIADRINALINECAAATDMSQKAMSQPRPMSAGQVRSALMGSGPSCGFPLEVAFPDGSRGFVAGWMREPDDLGRPHIVLVTAACEPGKTAWTM